MQHKATIELRKGLTRKCVRRIFIKEELQVAVCAQRDRLDLRLHHAAWLNLIQVDGGGMTAVRGDRKINEISGATMMCMWGGKSETRPAWKLENGQCFSRSAEKREVWYGRAVAGRCEEVL